MSRFLLAALVVAAACSPTPSTPDAGPPDAGGFPAPRFGGTAETDALANDPARCGQPAHAWLRSSEIGTVVSHTAVNHLTASTIDGLAVASGIALPREVYYDAKTTTITYRTQDRGEAVEATALVAWPFGLPLDGPPIPVLLVLHGTQGFTDGCSVDKTEGASVLAGYFASLGYLVVAPDYLGLKASGPATGFPHPYLVGQATAIAALDAVRAAGRLAPEERDEVEVAPQVVFFGGSQGGHAALWVDRLAPYYAPELELLGGVATVPPADLVGEATRALTSIVDATANVMAVMGVASPWYGAGERLGEVFQSPWDTDIPAAMAATCEPSLPEEPAALSDVFKPLLLDAAAAGELAEVLPFGCIFAENGLTTTSVRRIGPSAASYGVLFVLGEADALVHTPIERDAFAALCQAGTPARLLECAGARHVQATTWSLSEMLDFVEARVRREAFTPDCTVPAPTRCSGTPDAGP